MNKLTTQQLAEIRARHEIVKGVLPVTLGVGREAHTDRQQLLDHITALEAENKNLRKYVGHLDGCHITVVGGSPKMCSCKLNEILNKQESE